MLKLLFLGLGVCVLAPRPSRKVADFDNGRGDIEAIATTEFASVTQPKVEVKKYQTHTEVCIRQSKQVEHAQAINQITADMNDVVGQPANIATAATAGTDAFANAAAPFLVGVGAVTGAVGVKLAEDGFNEIFRQLNHIDEEGKHLFEHEIANVRACVGQDRKNAHVVGIGGTTANTVAGCAAIAFPPAWPAAVGVGFATFLVNLKTRFSTYPCTDVINKLNELLKEHVSEDELDLFAAVAFDPDCHDDWKYDEASGGYVRRPCSDVDGHGLRP